MRRATARLALCLAALLALLASSARAAGSPSLVEVGNAGFPDRAFVLTTPEPLKLGASGVRVLENGKPITDFSLVPAQQAAKGKFGVVLVLDASYSMHGRPIAGAMTAARAFAASRAPGQVIGLVAFNRQVTSTLVPTADQAMIDKALATTPRLAVGTYLYDGISAGISMLREAKVDVGSVVLLSDGRDTGSRLHLSQLSAQAEAAHIRIFTVGLRSYQFRPRTLERIAENTGAVYREAGSPEALTPIYQALSHRLSNEYLIQYQSQAGPGELVRVQISVRGNSATSVASYKTPALPSIALPPFDRSWLQRFWLSAGAMVLVSLAAGLLAAITLAGLVRGGRGSLRERMQTFVSLGGDLREQQQERASRTAVALDRALSRTRWWDRFKEELEIGEFPIPAVQLVLLTAAATVILAWLFGLLLPPVFIPFALGVPFITRYLVKRRLAEKRERFAEQLPDNLNILASALRAGHSFIGALSVMVDEADEPAQSEFRRALSDEQLGVPVEEALINVARRMANGDLEQVALVAALQRQTGGNTAEVLDTVVDTIRERADLRRMVHTLTAQGRISRWVLTGVPVFLALLVTVINPSYVRPLYHTSTGQLMLALAIAMVIAGSIVIKRIIDIKV